MKVRAKQRGVTILELMVVVSIVSIVVAIAVPTIGIFVDPQNEKAAVNRAIDAFAFARAKAKRLNRAILVDLKGFDEQRPKGSIELFQGTSGNCTLTAQRRDSGELEMEPVRRVPFGSALRGGYQGDVEEDIGLSKWQHNGGIESNAPLTLCLSPEGGIHQVTGGAATPLTGELVVYLQVFDHAAEGLSAKGLPLGLALHFSGSVRQKR